MCRASLLITCRSSTSNKVAGSPPNDASVGALLDDKRNKRGRQVWELLRGAYHSGRLPRFGCGNSTCGGPALHYGLFVALRQEILTSKHLNLAPASTASLILLNKKASTSARSG